MKNKYIWLLFIVIFGLSSCKKWIDTGMNTDPSNPSDVTIDLLLPSIEADLAYNLGGDITRPTSIWMQQLAGISNQSEDVEHYIYTESDVDNLWKYGLYGATMINLKLMMDKSTANGSPYYTGVGQVLMAYSLGITTDLFNRIPYTEALQGLGNLTPKYDTQKQIYHSMDSLLNAALVNLTASTSLFAPSPTSDLIYGGNLNNWIATIYSLKARYALHLSKINGAQAYQDALTAISNGAINDSIGDFEFAFGQNASNNSPVYQFETQRPQYVAVGALLIDTLKSANDPRLVVYADTGVGGTYYGSKPGELNLDASTIGDMYKAPDGKITFMSYVETKFIEAEANFQLNNKAEAAAAYNAAVKASLAKNGVSNPAWEAINANETAATITLEKIMLQKYLGLFMQLEVFTDWRRTGIPALQPSADNVTNNVIPRRYPYPVSERLQNPDNYIPGVKITDRVWWDGGPAK